MDANASQYGDCYDSVTMQSKAKQSRAEKMIQLSIEMETAKQGLSELEPVEVHDLRPGCHEISDKFFLRIRGCIDFG